jgi:diguanylate cyclase (GGDEF)-like protein/PAS domain S-box-containing protein
MPLLTINSTLRELLHDRLLESIFSFSSQGMLLLGVDATRPCYQVLSVNAVAQQLLGQYLPRTDLLQDERLVACLNQCWQQQVSVQHCYRRLCFSFIPLPEDSGRTTTGFILGLLDKDTSRSPIYENPARLSQLLDQLLGFIFSCESMPPWRLTYLSQGCYAVTGYTPTDFLSRGDQGLNEITYPQDLPQVLATIEQAIAHASPYEIEYRIHHRDGHLRWVREQGIPVLDSLGRVIAIDGAIADITLWKELEYALEQPIAGLNQWVGSDFVCHLAQFLSQQLGVDHVLIGEISGRNNDWVTTVAYCCQGELHPPLSYCLADTPCAGVLHADTCFYSQGVARLFPKDKMLATAGVEAYIGIPLRNSLGETLGLVAIMHSQPLERVAYIEGLLKIFGVRLTAELERIRAERALKAHEAHLEQQLRYEKLISTVASEFINLPLANIPEGIHKVLRLLGEITAADRSYLFERDTPTLRSFSNTYEWCAADIEPQQDTLQGVASTDFPLFFQQLYTQGHVLWPRVTDLPLDLRDRAGLDAQGIQSLIVVALRRGSEIIGFLGLDFVRQARQDLETLLPLMEVMAAIFTNVLERQEAERSLRSAESKYRSIFENAVEGMFQSTPEGRYLAVNPALARMYGYASPDELINTVQHIPTQIYVDPQRRQDFVAALEQHPTLSNFESQVYRKDGSIIWVSEHARVVRNEAGQVCYYEGTVEDITQSKLAAAQLQQATAEMEAIFAVYPDRYFRIAADTTILDYKGGAHAKLYVPESELLGRSMFEFLPTSVAKQFQDAIGQVLRDRALSTLTYSLPYPQGEQFFEARLLPFQDDEVVAFVRNISDRIRLDAELRCAEAKYRSIFENATEGIFQSTPDGYYLNVNPALARIYGYESPAQLQAELTDIAHQLYVDARRRDEFVQALAKNGIVTNFESQVYRRDGQIIWISENARAVYDDDGRLAYFEGTVVDITERKLSERTIHYQAFHDLLTGLPNRALFDDRLSLALAESRRSQQRVGVMFLDLDRFKVINDTLGHAIGDQLLQQVAERLVHCLRETDTIARWGGDEFTILLPMMHHSDDLAIVAERILHALKPEFILDGHHLHITTSIGIAVYPDHGESPDLLLRNADTALYRAKETGRNTYQFYTDSFNSAAHALLRLENDLHTALSFEELCLYYQPQLELKRRQIHHIEALVRWQHPTQGLLGPGRFINMAEENGLILPIGDWALRRACHDCQAWQRQQGLAGVGVAVNLSSRQFLHPNLLEEIQQSLAASRLPPHLLTLEITESTAIHNVNLTQQILSHLRALGVGIILDDFGTGYASLTYLKHFPITGLKIDRSFVEDIVSDRQDQAITKAIIDLAKGLGLPIVAEGVETVAQLEQLTALGCDVIQGFIFARPMPYAELLEWVQTAPPRIEC